MSKHDSRQIETVKVILHKGDKGSSIEKIEKTGTDVLVDTYTITLTDGSKQTFTVTNGKGIVSIEKTDTDVLIDTYTITFNDGDTQTFTVSNGKGIEDIKKTSQGLVDTYKVTFNDGTTETYTVTNGKGIESIVKTKTQGLVDTYTITFNDNEKQTYTVTNGRAIQDIQITSSQGLTDVYTIYFNDGTTLDIEFHKTNVEMDTELSTTSENPVQNKVITNALNDKSNTGHTHTKSEITDFAHTHDDRYYTESEINAKVSALNTSISGKADTGHTHDNRYYTESEINGLLNYKVTGRLSGWGSVVSFLNLLNSGAVSDNMIASVENLSGGTTNKIWSASTWSDKKLKKNIKPTKVKGLDIINNLDCMEFDYVTKDYGQHQDIGLIAQDIKKYVPNAIIEVPDQNGNMLNTTYAIAYEKIVPYLVKAIQELQAEVNQLKEGKS